MRNKQDRWQEQQQQQQQQQQGKKEEEEQEVEEGEGRRGLIAQAAYELAQASLRVYSPIDEPPSPHTEASQ